MGKLHHSQIKALAKGRHADGAGLRYVSHGDGRGSWEGRYRVAGKQRTVGYGSFPSVSLVQARAAHEAARVEARTGIDRVALKNGSTASIRASEGATIASLAPVFLEAHMPNLKNEEARSSWRSRFNKHVVGNFGDMAVEDIRFEHLCDQFRPMWDSQQKTVKHVLDCISVFLKWCRRRKLNVDALAVSDAKSELGKSTYVPNARTGLDWRMCPDYYQGLTDDPVDLALKLFMLVAPRSKPICMARREQFDLDRRVWNIPARNMKRSAAFAIPLTTEAVSVVKSAMRQSWHEEWLFPAHTKVGRFDSKKLLVRFQKSHPSLVVHALRKSLKTWTQDNSICDLHLADELLHHLTEKSQQRVYNESQYLEQRLAVQEQWVAHLLGESNVVPLRAIG